MSQNALTVPVVGVVSGLTMAQDINLALDTLVTNNSGPTEPPVIHAGMSWVDTSVTPYLLKIRNTANAGWTTVCAIDTGPTYNLFDRIINGAMSIDQENNGGVVTPASGTYTLDMWSVQNSVASKYSVQQNGGAASAPVGYANYLRATSLSSYSVGSSDYFAIQQRIEGLYCTDLAFGTASASPVCLAFWVRSSLTGTFGGSLRNSAANRSYPFAYTINAANTWELKTVTVPGDVTGTWLVTNGIGLNVTFSLGAGSTYSGAAGAWNGSFNFSANGAVSVVATNGATLDIAGVRLVKGTFMPSIDPRPYPLELMLVQRYFESSTGYATYVVNNQFVHVGFKVQKRAVPSLISLSSGTVNGSTVDGFNASTSTGTPVNFAFSANSRL